MFPIPCAIAIALLLIGACVELGFLLNFAYVLLAFGAMAIVPAKFLGGITILASAIGFLMLSIKVALTPDGMNQMVMACLNSRKLAVLFLFTVIAVAGGFILPRVFAGMAQVFPMNGNGFLTDVGPSGSNFNQSVDVTISFLVACAFFVMAQSPSFEKQYGVALLWGAGSVIVTGAADMVSPMLHLGPIMDSFRTASYVFMLDNVVLDARRIIGLMPEASSYGTLAAALGGIIVFCRNAYSPKIKAYVALPMGLCCLVLAALSTSSSAYGALAVILTLIVADQFYRLVIGNNAQKVVVTRELWIGFCVLLLVVCFIAINDNFRNMASRMLDSIVFKKSQTDSYMERTSWTRAAMGSFYQTFGMGVGIGTARTSNFFVNIISSTGVIGTAIFCFFLLQFYFARLKPRDYVVFELAHGLKLGSMGILAGLYLCGTVPDYGPLLASIFGTAVGLSYRARKNAVLEARASQSATLNDLSPARPIRSARRADRIVGVKAPSNADRSDLV